MRRKLAAVLAADVEGFARLTEADEDGTLAALGAQRAVFDAAIARYRGRIANTAGDSVLAEFPSVADAVQCAVEAQTALGAAMTPLPPERRLLFRIGIHLGDVVERDGDLLGTGVNIAARLQTLAKAGGIVISFVVHDQVRKSLPYAFADLGPQQVKNIDEPVHAFAVGTDHEALAGATAVGASPLSEPNQPLPLPDKPSIAVLPFQNMSGDPEQEYFADGIVEDIITALSRFKSLFVIARNSSFTYKGKAVDIKQVGRKLGVRYVLEGSVRKAGGHVRITGQLIDTISGAHVWADRFDRELVDIFALQDDVTQSVVSALEPNLRSAEIARTNNVPTQNLNAYDLYLRALAQIGTFTKDSMRTAEAHLRRAVSLDPGYSDAWALLTDCLGHQIVAGWLRGPDAIKEVMQAAATATRVGPENGLAHAVAGAYALLFGGAIDEAVEHANRAIALHPNSDTVRACTGWILMDNGEFETALEQFQAGLRIGPFGPRVGDLLGGIAYVRFYQRRFDEAIEQADRTLARMSANPAAVRLKTAALAHVGRLDEARDSLRHLLLLSPNASLSRTRWVTRHQWMRELMLDGLRLAGMPE